MLTYPGHKIVTMRNKSSYVVEINSKGKQAPREIGLQPVQRDGLKYDFDIVGDMDHEHNLIMGAVRYDKLDGKVFNKPGQEFVDILIDFIGDPNTIETTAPPFDRDTALKSIEKGEPICYKNNDGTPNEFAIKNARKKYLDGLKPENSTDEKLEFYLKHMRDKAKEKSTSKVA